MIIIDLEVDAQYRFGWLNIVTIPFMHTFDNVIGTILASMSGQLPNGLNEVQTYRDIVKTDILGSEKDQNKEYEKISEIETKDLVRNLPYFIMPGFQTIYRKIQEIVKTDSPSQQNMPNREKLRSMLENIFTMYGETLGDDVGMVTVSAKLYDILVKMLFTVIISIFVVIKIVFWLFDILKYFFVSPFVVFWGFINDKGQDQIGKFIGRGFILFLVRPILIVVTVLLFVVGYDIFYFIYETGIGDVISSVNLVQELSDIFGTTSDVIIGISYITGGLNSLFNIMLLLVLTFVGYKMIMDGDVWILSVLGYSDQAITKNDMSPNAVTLE